jgi:OmpA-OmpF porin, OOP family
VQLYAVVFVGVAARTRRGRRKIEPKAARRQPSIEPSLEMTMSQRHFLIAILLLALLAGAAMAQDVRQYRADDTVNPREVADILGQPTQAEPAMKMRSIRLLDGEPSPTKGQAARRTDALSLPVQFAFDSADIQPSARKQLDALAEGIRLLPETKAVQVQGHTDATGSEKYNELLSQRRAIAVKNYLVAAGIDAARLHAVGKGQHAPLPGTDPYAAENRRVQFRGE